MLSAVLRAQEQRIARSLSYQDGLSHEEEIRTPYRRTHAWCSARSWASRQSQVTRQISRGDVFQGHPLASASLVAYYPPHSQQHRE